METVKEEEEVSTSRLFIWEGTLALVSDHLFTGTKYGERTFVIEAWNAYTDGKMDYDMAEGLWTARMPHKSYLYVLFFMGIFASIVLVLLFYFHFKASFSKLMTDRFARTITFKLGLFCGLLGFCLMIFFDFQLFVKTTAACFWCLLGINVSFFHFDQLEENQQHET